MNFYQLIEKVTSKVVGKSTLPEPQQKLFNSLKSNQNSEKFFILNDGSFVYCSVDNEHSWEADNAGTSLESLLDSGAIRGISYDEIGFNFNADIDINSSQLNSIFDVINRNTKYKFSSNVIISFNDGFDTIDYSIPIDKKEHIRSVILGHGKTPSKYKLTEAVSVADLPDVQKDIKDKSKRYYSSYKFWILSDGSFVDVSREHDFVGAGTDLLLISGAIRAGDDFAMIDHRIDLTDEQIESLMKVFKNLKRGNVFFIDFVEPLSHSSYSTTAFDASNSIASIGLKNDNDESISKFYNIITSRGRFKVDYSGEPIFEATYQEIGRKQLSINKLFPVFPDRVKAVQDKGGIRLVDTDKNILHFKVHSGTKEDVWYQCGVNFKQLKNTLKNLIWLDRSVWKEDRTDVDFRKLAMSMLDNSEIRLSCSCPAQLYWGGDYILSRPKRDAKIGDPENRPPIKRNPHEYGAHCKHLQNVFKALPFYGPTIASWLKEFHSKEIAEIVKAYKIELARIKGKKTKAVEEPKKVEAPEKEPVKTEPSKEKPKEDTPKVKEEPKKEKPAEKPKKAEKSKEEPEKKQEKKPEVKVSAEVEKPKEEDKKKKEI